MGLSTVLATVLDMMTESYSWEMVTTTSRQATASTSSTAEKLLEQTINRYLGDSPHSQSTKPTLIAIFTWQMFLRKLLFICR